MRMGIGEKEYSTTEATAFLNERGVPISANRLNRLAEAERIESRKVPRTFPGARRKQYWYFFAESTLVEFVRAWREEHE